MNNKLYYIAYKFLKFRANGIDPFLALENLKYEDKELVIDFLKRNHQVKFL